MAKSRLKDKRIRHILKDSWLRVTERPVPTNEDITAATLIHNADYEIQGQSQTGNGTSNGGGQGQSRWWGDRYTRGEIMQGEEWPRPVAIEPRRNLDWTCEVADVKDCPIVKAPIVEVPVEMYRTWIELAQEFDTEWMAYLIGTIDAQTGRGTITEMYFPPQSASGAHVEQPDESYRPRPGTIAAVHSHVQMEVFFSKTDEDHANWPVEIVINARGESKMAMRVKLECGRFSRVTGKVMLTGMSANQVYIDQLKEAMRKRESNASVVVTPAADVSVEDEYYQGIFGGGIA